MKRLIFHVGITKTGTTSLQKFFLDNKEKLKDIGLNYPVFENKNKSDDVRNGIYLVSKCNKKYKENNTNSYYGKEYDNDYYDSIFNNSFNVCENVLLSDECFYEKINVTKNLTYEKARILALKELSNFLIQCDVDKVTFIVYLRPQHEHTASAWKESVKHFAIKSFNECIKREYYKYIHDYYSFIRVMEECLEIPHEIMVRIYDRNNFVGGDIYHDFCDAIGIPWNDEFVIPEKERNRSYTYDVAEALRTIRPCIPKEYIKNVRLAAFNLSIKNPDPKGLTPFTKEEIKEYMKQFEEGNRKIARKYFMRDQLFPDIDYDNVITWIPNEKKIKEYRKELLKACPYYTRILASIYSIELIRHLTPQFIKKLIVRKLVHRR